jgi:hypothetical protein
VIGAAIGVDEVPVTDDGVAGTEAAPAHFDSDDKDE